MREFDAPDLDPIKRREQGCGEVRSDPSADIEPADEDRNQRGRFTADLLQKQQIDKRRFNEWL